jgi:hypothetical protein
MVCLNLYKWKMSSLKLTMKNNVNVHNCASNSFVKFFQRESYHKHHVYRFIGDKFGRLNLKSTDSRVSKNNVTDGQILNTKLRCTIISETSRISRYRSSTRTSINLSTFISWPPKKISIIWRRLTNI